MFTQLTQGMPKDSGEGRDLLWHPGICQRSKNKGVCQRAYRCPIVTIYVIARRPWWPCCVLWNAAFMAKAQWAMVQRIIVLRFMRASVSRKTQYTTSNCCSNGI